MTGQAPASTELVWLITGTTSGFGQRLVDSALARGDYVIATARSSEKLQAAHIDRGTTDRIKLIELDVTSGFDSIKAVVDQAAAIWGRIDVLVNNAGIGLLGLTEEAGTAMLRRQFETNVFGVVDVTNAVLPHMRARKQGTVVVVGSRSVWRSETPGIGTYAASKAAVHAITASLASEVAQFNIRVLLLSPGAFRTEGMYQHPFNTDNPIADYDAYRQERIAAYASVPGSEPGDPAKAMEVLVDVVKGEGVAVGKTWPWTLLLGADAERDLKTRWDRHQTTLQEWGDVTRSVSF